jgi:formylglycine-generating enzyme required for sulfatase activity
MYRSGDFGQTWTNISVPTTNDLYGVAFGKTESDIYVVGESGTVMQSSNFGQTWTNIDISTTSNLYDIASDRTNSHFFIVGEGGAMYRAGSFGGAWTDISLPTTTNFFGASFGETDRNVYVVGQTVPEPSTFSLLGIGAIGLIVWIWRWKRTNSLRTISLAAVMVFVANTTTADSFGIGENQFTIDFVPITYTSNPSSGYGIVNNAYRMGTYEITNEQWNKFILSYGTVTGSPITAYDQPPNFTGTNVPTNNVSWYEAAQFVNWLNTSTGHHEAYAFTGTQGTGDYSLTTWNATEADQGTNLLRHKDAFYFLPTVHEWAKAAYWNGTTLQNYATQDGDWPPQGNGTSGTGWNYWNNTTGQFATTPPGPWIVGSGSQELNGTYDMMGNVWEWMENPFFSPSSDPQYNSTDYPRGVRGGSYSTYWGTIISSDLGTDGTPTNEFNGLGFRVASIPEPASIILFGAGILGGFTCYWRRKHFYR